MGRPADNGVDGEHAIGVFQQAYADAILRGDGEAAERVVAEAIAASLDEAAIQDRIVAPSLRMVGDLWAQGEIDVADEHLATEISLRVLTLQREAFRVARKRAGHRVLLATVPGERHDVGLRMVASLLLHGGFDVRMLGPDLPLDALAAATGRHTPSVVGLGATLPESGPALVAAVEVVRDVAPGVGVIVGGAAASTVARLPGVAVCHHVSDAPGLVEGLLQRPHAN